ncbi:MAG TPA: HesA/MoeB/ThiF family protein [Pedobacter sp.]|jgi:adenylyltransferase/sulfurtransferase
MTLSAEESLRYRRHLQLEGFGAKAQMKLKQSRVLMVGAGGLGCPCLLYLAAAGVGMLGIADGDLVSISNLQRQVLYDTSDIGLPKTEAAKMHLQNRNPLVEIITHPRVTRENVIDIVGRYDLVIDGSDNFETRYLLNDACVLTNKPYIYGALSKFEGQVSTFNYNNGPTYRCLYPTPPQASDVPACNEAGVLGVLPGIIGTMQATEAIKIITEIGKPLSGKVLLINLLLNSYDTFDIKPNPENRTISSIQSLSIEGEIAPISINYSTLQDWLDNEDILLIDVREEYEFEAFNIGGMNIPYTEIDELLTSFNKDRKIVIICQTGARSLNVLLRLKDKFPGLDIFNLERGLQAIF